MDLVNQNWSEVIVAFTGIAIIVVSLLIIVNAPSLTQAALRLAALAALVTLLALHFAPFWPITPPEQPNLADCPLPLVSMVAAPVTPTVQLTAIPTVALSTTAAPTATQTPSVSDSSGPAVITLLSAPGLKAQHSSDFTEVSEIQLATTAPITDLRLLPIQLARQDGQGRVTTEALQIGCKSLSPLDHASIYVLPLRSNLHNVPAGDYSGNLAFYYTGGSISFPVTLKVKDKWELPLLILFGGLLIGYAITNYRTNQRSRDLTIVQAAALVRFVQSDLALSCEYKPEDSSDEGLGKSFGDRIISLISLIDEGGVLSDATATTAVITQAQALRDKWIQGRDGANGWLAVLRSLRVAHRDITTRQLEHNGSQYLATLARMAQDLHDTAADKASPQELSGAISAFQDWYKKYLDAERRISLAKDEEIPNLRIRLDTLIPGSPTFDTDYRALTDSIQPDPTKPGFGANGQSDDSDTGFNFASGRSIAQAGQEAQARLSAYQWLATAAILIALGFTGFNTLYVVNPIFGANSVVDYLGLFVWGLGSQQVSAAAIGTVAENWGVTVPSTAPPPAKPDGK